MRVRFRHGAGSAVRSYEPHRRVWRLYAVAAAVALLIGAGLPAATQVGATAARPRPTRPAASAAIPSVTGPVTGPGSPSLVGFEGYPLSRIGYSESEYFFSGMATSYVSASPFGKDGKWSVQAAAAAPYKSRLVVLLPSDPKHFSGNVVVEWLNVSAGFDAPPDWVYGHDEMVRSGDAWVGVSAQAVGVNSLKTTTPARYGSLIHPGDSFSYDIFSQAGMAVRENYAMILNGLRPRVIIGDGESQSAGRLTTYVNAAAPLVNVFDGYLIHSRGSTGAALSQAPQAAIPTPAGATTRDDLTVPVVTFETETDVIPFGYVSSRQPDSQFFRLWEVAGTTHIDAYNLGVALSDDGNCDTDLALFAYLSSPPTVVNAPEGLPISFSCGGTGFNAGQQHYVFQTALQGLLRWASTGVPLPKMPRLEVDTSTTPPTFRLDTNGNARGGIRTPAVDAPLAVLSGIPAPNAPGFCGTFGQTHPFTSIQVAELYPTHADFVRQWRRAVKHALSSGVLLPDDARRLADVVG